MLKRKSVQNLLLSVGVILAIYLLAAAISLTTQKPINKADSTPAGVPGVQFTVVNKSMPNAKPLSAISDASGGFDLGLVPAGTYSMTLRIADDTNERRLDPTIKQPLLRSSTTLGTAEITILGTTEGVTVRGWDFKEKKAVDLASSQRAAQSKMTMDKMRVDQGAARTTTDKNPPDILFTVDGRNRVTGAVKAIRIEGSDA